MSYQNKASIQHVLRELLSDGPTFIMLVGCPGSGKSSLAKELQKYEEYDGFTVDIVNPDDIREDICGDRYDQSRNSDVFSEVHSQIGESLASKFNVIYDATNAYSKFRAQIMSTVSKYECNKVCVIMSTSLLNSINQNSGRENPVDDKTIERMYLSIMSKTPSLNEGFDIVLRY